MDYVSALVKKVHVDGRKCEAQQRRLSLPAVCVWCNESWGHWRLRRRRQQRMWTKSMWRCLFYLKPPWNRQRQKDSRRIWCSASASGMFLLIRVVGVHGIYPSRNTPWTGPQSLTGQRRTKQTLMQSQWGGLDMQHPHRETRKMAANVLKGLISKPFL